VGCVTSGKYSCPEVAAAAVSGTFDESNESKFQCHSNHSNKETGLPKAFIDGTDSIWFDVNALKGVAGVVVVEASLKEPPELRTNNGF
jgi:hypothetical protein